MNKKVTNTKINSNYRERIYANYGKNFQDAVVLFDEKESERWGSARNWHLREWLPQDKFAKIVDMACGGGKLLHFFREQGYPNVSGVDISPDQVALSRQVIPDVIQGNVIDFMESHPGEFDLVIGFDIIEHFYKDEVLRFLDAAYNSLKPGGRLILQTPNAEGPWGAQYRYGDFSHEVGFNPNSLKRLMQLVGLTDIECRECDPTPLGYSIFSTVRALLWQFIRVVLMSYNLIETGGIGGRVLTRVFLATGVRR
jgi:2-polyprenyl-3-methyl-5-hydroxy-6-metoxy-1,4-benzoquinol methylase